MSKTFQVQIDGKGPLQDMTVGDLRQALADLPDRTVVTLASDAEGNAIRPLMQVTIDDEYRPPEVTLWPMD